MNDIHDIACWLREREIDHEAAGPIAILVATSIGGLDAGLTITWHDEGVVQLTQVITMVPEERFAEVALELARINADLLFPGLVLDEEQGIVCYRIALLADGGGLPAALFERALGACIRIATSLFPRLHALAASVKAQPRPSLLAAEVLAYLA